MHPDLAARNGSVLDLLYGDHTFVNAPLARHYGVAETKISPDQWVRLDNARRYGRGGLLPMSVFLTKNAPGLRTSPVKRGYWVARRLLGEHIRLAQRILETTGVPLEVVAARAGFGSAATMRSVFARRLRTSPRAYRRTFRAATPAGRSPEP